MSKAENQVTRRLARALGPGELLEMPNETSEDGLWRVHQKGGTLLGPYPSTFAETNAVVVGGRFRLRYHPATGSAILTPVQD